MSDAEILARGPWDASQVTASWRSDLFQPSADLSTAADRAIAELEKRGSPFHDGVAGRVDSYSTTGDGLDLTLQPARWSLRLTPETAQSLSVLCMARAADGRWLAGRRAGWVASWAGKWALGAGGAVEVGENPVETMTRELQEEWSVTPERFSAELLVGLPTNSMMLVGLAWLPEGAEVTRDEEHDDHAWWPAEIDLWPSHADARLGHLAKVVTR